MSNETHCGHCGEQSTQTTCEKCENAAISVEFRRRKDALAKVFPPIDWKARCEAAEAELNAAKQERNAFWIQLQDSQKELAAINGNVTKAPHAKECAIAEWELRAWAYGRGHGPKPPDKPACNCWKAGPWTTAEPRAGEMTKEQK